MPFSQPSGWSFLEGQMQVAPFLSRPEILPFWCFAERVPLNVGPSACSKRSAVIKLSPSCEAAEPASPDPPAGQRLSCAHVSKSSARSMAPRAF